MRFYISIYILTDKDGEWWEFLKTDNSLDKFERGTSNFKKDKSFSDFSKALKYAKKHVTEERYPTEDGKQRRFRIIGMSPPIKPSIVYGQQIMYDSKE